MSRTAYVFGILFWIAAVSSAGAAPSTYLPLNHRAYDFLERMEHHYFVTGVRLGIKPATRARVAELLVKVKDQERYLSRADREEYRCLLDEFRPDIPSRFGLVWDDQGPIQRLPGVLSQFAYRNRRNLYSASGDEYSLYVDPVVTRSAAIGTRKTPVKDERVYVSGNGFTVRGTAGNHLGFHVDVRDSKEWGSREYPLDTSTTTPGRGYVSFKGDHAEFDETSAELTYTNGPVTLLYGRGKNQWGRGKRGTLGMSGYAAPYDMLRLETEFWRLRYVFAAAEIEQYPPVAQFYYNPPAGIFADSVTVAKRFAAHRLEFDLTDRLNLGFYETVIYGGRWDLSYLNPLMFLRGAEHTNGDHDNAAMGMDFRLFVHRSHSIYGELFIDDITTTKLGTDWYGNKLGWQFGTFLVEPLGLHDMDIRVEYTRIQPWTYSHRYSINVYDHYGSTLGYPAGPNSDEIFTELRKRFSRKFNVSVYGLRGRHGANPPGGNVGGDIKLGFRDGDSTHAKFLGGILEKRTAVGFDVSWEPLWQLFLKAGYTYEDRDGKGNTLFRFSIGLNE